MGYASSKEAVNAPDLQTLANEVIEEEDMDLTMCTVKYVKVYPYISKKTVGRCRSTNYRERLFTDGADYIIEMSGEIWDALDDKRKRILMLHELMHIYPVYSEKKQEYNFKTRNHDVEDFASIIDDHGPYWFDEIRTIVSSYYDMDPDQAREISA